MNNLVAENEKLMTLKEVADATGAAYRTVADYAQRAGLTVNGKTTLLNEQQVTVILEAMKGAHNGGSSGKVGAANLANNLQGINTEQSAALKIELLNKQIQAIL